MAPNSCVDAPAVKALVHRVVRRILGATHPDLEDVVQDSLLGLLLALPTFRGEAPLRVLAARIAERRAIDAVRSAMRMRRRLASWNDGADSGVTTGDPFDARVRCREILTRLSGIQGRTLLMRGVGGYSVAEIARSTGVSVETVRSRLRLARRSSR